MKKSSLKILLIFIPIFIIGIVLSVFHYIGFEKIDAYFSTIMFSDDFDKKKPLSTKNYDMLNETEKKAYICIFNNIENHPEYIKIPKLTQSEFTDVYFAVKNDNPDILCFADSCNMISFLSSCFLQLHYDYPKDICATMTAELDAEVDRIMQNIDISDEYTTELAIHDYIILNCAYTEDAKNASSAYGCLIDGESVCSGYSRAAMLLLSRAGIESMLIGGTGVTADENDISHMWNIVWINNIPYHLDVTWDDPGSANDTVSHMFFNLTTEQISADHKDMSLNIDCNSTDENYFVREEVLYNEYNSSTLQDIMTKLCKNIDSGINYLELTFSDSDSYNAAVHSIIDNSANSSDMYKIIEFVSENATNKIDISHINFVHDPEKKYIRLMFDEI